VQQNRFDSVLFQSSATHFCAACDDHSVATLCSKFSWRKIFREKTNPYLDKLYVFVRWRLHGAISGLYNSTN